MVAKMLLVLGGLIAVAMLGGGVVSQLPTESPYALVSRAADGTDDFLPDFSYAGYGFGIEPLPVAAGTVIRLEEFGAHPDDGVDDSNEIRAALEAARSVDGPVVLRFQPGRYLLTEVLSLNRSNLVLQGAGQGTGGTEIHMPRPLAMVDTGARFEELREYLRRYNKLQREPQKNLHVLFSEYSWTGGFLWVGRDGERAVPYLEELDEEPTESLNVLSGDRGGKTIKVEQAQAFAPGDWVEVLWYSVEQESGIIQSIYGETDLAIGSHHWSFPNRALVRHRTKVERVHRNELHLASPLPHSINTGSPAAIKVWEPLEHIGIEELRFTFPDAPFFGHHVERGYNAVYLTGAADSWVRNVTVTNGDAGILTDDAAYLTLRDIRIDGTRRGHYGVHMGSVQNVLAERLEVAMPVIHSLTFNTKSSRSVYKDAVVRSEPVIDQHAGSNHQNLFDNVTLYLSAERGEDGPYFDVFDGSGAGYWQPGHGRYNTVWNLRLQVEGGMNRDEVLNVRGLAEGPDARIVGLHANHPVSLDYRPQPLVASLGTSVTAIPSLYAWQLEERRRAAAAN